MHHGAWRTSHERAELRRFVQLSSERMVEPVSQDRFFAEKRESHAALLLIVRLESLGIDHRALVHAAFRWSPRRRRPIASRRS